MTTNETADNVEKDAEAYADAVSCNELHVQGRDSLARRDRILPDRADRMIEFCRTTGIDVHIKEGTA